MYTDTALKAADFYPAHSFPFFLKGINKFIMSNEIFPCLAVAEKRQLFTILAPRRLPRCTEDCYTVCPSNFVPKNRNSRTA
jgi:hypothetical protein